MPVDITRDAFKAISDPRRRKIIELICHKKANTIPTISQQVGVSAAAVYEHIGILQECGFIKVVLDKSKYRRNHYVIDINKLKKISKWIDDLVDGKR